MARSTVVLFQTHYFDRAAARTFWKLQKECPPHATAMVLIHVPPGTPKPPLLANVPHHFVTTPEIRNPAYPGKSAGGPEWRIWDGGHTDLPHLHFYQQDGRFDRYWSIEYDVRFSGSWRTFFDAFEDNDADLLTTSLRTAATHPDWPIWPMLKAPGGHDVALTADQRICSFMPIWRATRQAMQVMDQRYREGWTGHSELTWPTILHRAGLKIEDIGGHGAFVSPANRGRFYTNTMSTWDLSPGSFVYKPARHGTWWRRNRLWHPVKPLRVTVSEDFGRVRQKLQVLQRRLVERDSGLTGPTQASRS
jgi:hypothetical protein